MSFFDEISAAHQAARDEKIRIEQEKRYHATHLTDDDQRAIAKVKSLCTGPELKPKILNAAKNLKDEYVLYKGNDLMPLHHLDYDIRNTIINDIKQAILAHYGTQFDVSYHDRSYDGYGESLMNATFTLEW